MKTNLASWGFILFCGWLIGGCNNGTSDGAGGAGGDAPTTSVACSSDAQCDDRVFCNGKEVCERGQCRYGTRLDCSDGIECTIDRCDEATETCVSSGPDVDGDGHIDATCDGSSGEPLGDDCDDQDELRFPGNSEVCDAESRDEDCDPQTLGFRDSDNDGFIDALCCNEQEDGELECGEDCDDYRANVNPNATEACDFFDNNCDGKVDEGVSVELYPDKDHDGHGESSAKQTKTCPGAVGFSEDDLDCADDDPEVFKGQFEICDDKDNNCDGDVDEIEEQAPWFSDLDEDTYGDPTSAPVWSCYRIVGRVLSHNDCNDQEVKVNPNRAEECDALDNDCNGLADFRLTGINNFEDDDKDGVADSDCGGDDCNDRDARTAAGADEVCDRVDNDCDGEVDEQTTQNIWYIDEDGDGWGVVIGSALASCDPLPARARQFGDCDDSETGNDIHPGSTEYCDGKDNDCDGSTDEGATAYCQVPNAIPTCKDGLCAVFTCEVGFADVDGDPENGCEEEIDPSSLITATVCQGNFDCNNGNLCDGIERCTNGFCVLGNPVNCTPSPSVIDGDVFVQDGRDIRDLAGVTFITGSLRIEGTQVSSLVGLESLKMIGGNLEILNNQVLLKLSGSALSNLETVGGTITIESNPSLVNVNLPSLLSARGLRIRSNNALVNITGFENLSALEDLKIQQNNLLKSITAFKNLTRIGGASAPYCPEGCYACGDDAGGLNIYSYFSAIEDISGLDNLTEIGGDACFIYVMSETVGLPRLRKVGMTLQVTTSDVYASGDEQILSGPKAILFPALETIGSLDASLDGSLLTEVRFPKLKTAGDFEADLNAENLIAFELPLLQTSQRFVIGSNAGKLKNLTLPKLKTVNTFSLILDGGALESISFNELKTVTSSLVLYSSSTSSDGYTKLESIDFQKLESAQQVQVAFGSPYYPVGPTALERISFPRLESSALSLRSYQTLTAFREMDFGQLKQANGISIQWPFVVPEGAPGLDLSSLEQINVEYVEPPQNNGQLQVCTGVLNAQQTYENAACTLISSIVEGGYIGTPDSCGQCTAQVPPPN